MKTYGKYVLRKSDGPDATHRTLLAEDLPTKTATEAKLPPYVNLSNQFPQAYDQQNLGSCSSFASVTLFEWLLFVETGTWQTFSKLWQYQQELILNGTFGQDTGATLQQAVQVLETKGVVPDSAWPYDVSKFTTPPPALTPVAKLDPTQVRYLGHNFDSLAVRSALASGLPILCGFYVYPTLEPLMWPGNELSFSGVMKMPNCKANLLLGGHANIIVGYVVNRDGYVWYLLRNQWTPNWALSGYYWMPEGYLMLYGFDFYTFLPNRRAPFQPFIYPDVTPRKVPMNLSNADTNNETPPVTFSGSVWFTTETSTLTLGSATTIGVSTSEPVPEDCRVWFGYAIHMDPIDNLSMPGWFWWQEMAPNTDRTAFSTRFDPPQPTPEHGYSLFVARILPSTVVPDRFGDPSYMNASTPYPEALQMGVVVTGERRFIPPSTPAPEIIDVEPRYGTPGTEVTITGNGFVPGTDILFDKARATIKQMSFGKAVVVAPPAKPGRVYVSAFNRNGMSLVGDNTVTAWEYMVQQKPEPKPPESAKKPTLSVVAKKSSSGWSVYAEEYRTEKDALEAVQTLKVLAEKQGYTPKN